MFRIVLILLLALGLTACSSTLENVENKSNRLTTSWALGKPYTQVASLGTSRLAQLSAEQTGFGDMIGRSELADGTTLYRHIAAAAKTDTNASFVGLVGRNTNATNFRLSYFKVGQDGIVKDWATGSVPGTASRCINFIGGIFQKCADQAAVKQDLVVYDAQVLTRANQPLSTWGTVVEAVPFVTNPS